MDGDGDLTLIVGLPGTPMSSRFLVCSRTLSRASPVFKAMLYGSFKEAFPDDPKNWVVTLPEDNPGDAMILLDIIHSRFGQIPSQLGQGSLSLDKLYHILVFADKYDMTQLLRPWLQDWISGLGFLRTSNGIWPAIAIAHELGSEEVVGHLVRRITSESRCDDQGNIVVRTNGALYPTINLETSGLPLVPFGLAGKFPSFVVVGSLD